MFKKFKISKKLINQISKETVIAFSKVVNKKFNKFDNSFFDKLENNKKLQSKIFDLFNMLPILHKVHYEIANYLENKFKKKVLTWTYPQIRIDMKVKNIYSAPPHQDKWILDKDLKGYVVWFPITKYISSILISKKKIPGKVEHDPYWGIKFSEEKKYSFKKINVKYGEAIIFDESLIHKSFDQQNRITVQCRYHIFSKKFKVRAVQQKITQEIIDYWKNKV